VRALVICGVVEKLLKSKAKMVFTWPMVARLTSGQPAPIDPKEAEPPVWRMEDDARAGHRVPEQLPARKGVLARQRRRDMLLFFFYRPVHLRSDYRHLGLLHP
jgi:hypothetical protein